MAKDIFTMTREEFQEKVKLQHLRVKSQNAEFGLPTTGYSETHKCVVETYISGRVKKININKSAVKVAKQDRKSVV